MSRRSARGDRRNPPALTAASARPCAAADPRHAPHPPQVRIFCPARSACQQGLQRTGFGAAPSWRIDFDTQHKWTNPLMGWTSTADSMENVSRSSLQFFTKEEAMAFCHKHGWEFVVEEPNVKRAHRTKRYAGYGDNFRCAGRRIDRMQPPPAAVVGARARGAGWHCCGCKQQAPPSAAWQLITYLASASLADVLSFSSPSIAAIQRVRATASSARACLTAPTSTTRPPPTSRCSPEGPPAFLSGRAAVQPMLGRGYCFWQAV